MAHEFRSTEVMLLEHDCSCSLVHDQDPSILHQGITGREVNVKDPRVSMRRETNNTTRPILSGNRWCVLYTTSLLSYFKLNFCKGCGWHTLSIWIACMLRARQVTSVSTDLYDQPIPSGHATCTFVGATSRTTPISFSLKMLVLSVLGAVGNSSK